MPYICPLYAPSDTCTHPSPCKVFQFALLYAMLHTINSACTQPIHVCSPLYAVVNPKQNQSPENSNTTPIHPPPTLPPTSQLYNTQTTYAPSHPTTAHTQNSPFFLEPFKPPAETQHAPIHPRHSSTTRKNYPTIPTPRTQHLA